MDKKIIEKWETNKNILEQYFKTTNQREYDEYSKLVKLIIRFILNQDVASYDAYSEEITVIDDGDYQGTQIFIIHKETYQPDITDYIYTNNYYGSCSGCDTLMSINMYEEGLPNEEQVKDYMQLCLHLVQRIRKMWE